MIWLRKGSLHDINAGPIEDGPLVSIIVPVYNTAEGPLRRCFRSLITQDYSNIDLIVVDDGSSPQCVAVLRDILASEPFARIIESEHKGVSHARNVGIEAAKGEWIAFSDAEDEFEPYFVSEALRVAITEEVHFVCGSVSCLYKGDEPDFSKFAHDYCVVDEVHNMSLAAKQMLSPTKNKDFDGPNFKGRGPVAKLYSRERIGNLRFNLNIHNGEDTLFNYLYLRRCQSLAIVNSLWYLYYQYEGSSAHSTELKPWKDSIVGILATREKDEPSEPFISRCAYMTTEVVTSLIGSLGVFKTKSLAIEIIKFARDHGCFTEKCFSGFETSPWLTLYVWLCKKDALNMAYWVLCIKTFLRNFLKNRVLIDPNSVAAS